MQDQGLGSWPTRRARMSPARPALVQGTRTRTYGELDRRVTRLAHGLRARGVVRGDRVAFLGLNSIELVETLFAVAKLGAVFLPLNTRLAPPETAYILEDSAPRLLLHDHGFEAPDTVRSFAVDEPMSDDDTPLDEPVAHHELVMVQYTSGTSGRPKGVMLTHGNIIWNVCNLLVDVDLRSDEVALVTAPLFHTAALNQLLLPTLLKGGTAILEPRFDAERVVDLIEERGVTFLFGVTSMYLALAQTPGWAAADLHTLRTALSGGAPVPASLLETWQARGLSIIQGYGLTESSPGATMTRADESLRKLGSAGTSCFFSDVRVVTADGRPVAVDEVGEVLVQGPNVTPGYWNQPEATAAALDGGWLRTGDLARVDDEGYLFIVDRLKDMYISGGENVYPAEVEAAIYTHLAVAECAVVGVPDERWGEVGRAVVALRPGHTLTQEELLEHLTARLARYKLPKTVVVTEELPHNASGKLVRSRVRDLHA